VGVPGHPRITIESGKRDGKPCIRGMRITVNDVLGWLAHGMTEEEILEEHPGLEKETLQPCMVSHPKWRIPPTAVVDQGAFSWIRTSRRS
jgi:uncharacterized protein (DUF433 family)